MNYIYTFFTCLLLLFSSFQAFSFQNLDELLADPDITWVGEVYVDYHPNLTVIAPSKDEIKNRHETLDYNLIKLLKVKNRTSGDQLEPIPGRLCEQMFQLNKKTLNVYKDADLKEKLSYKAYQEIIHQKVSKTKMYSDPETFEQIIEVIESEINANNIELFRLKQLLTYNAKTNQLNIIPLAIAPLQYINKFASSEEKALFWIPIKEAFQSIDLDNSSINWAKRFDKDIISDSIKTIKGTKDLSTLFLDMISEYRTKPTANQIYRLSGKNKALKALESEEIKKLGIIIDTLLTIDIETYEEVLQIVNTNLDTTDLSKIRLVQDWAWDEKTQTMQIRVLGFFVLENMFDTSIYPFKPYYYIKART